MKKILISLGLFFIIVNGVAQTSQFVQGDWQTVTNIAQQENKDIMVYFRIRNSMGDSEIENNVFTDKLLMSELTKHFILYSIEKQRMDGKIIFENAELFSEPTFAFFDKNGNPLHQRCWILTSNELLRVSKDIRNPDSAFYLLQNSYQKDTSNEEVLYKYLISKSRIGVFDISSTDYDIQANKYFNSIAENEIFSSKNWFAIKQLVYSVNDEMFEFVVKNKSKFIELHGNEVNEFINNIILENFMASPMRFQKNGDKSLYSKTRQYVVDRDTSDSKQMVEFIDSLFKEIESMSEE